MLPDTAQWKTENNRWTDSHDEQDCLNAPSGSLAILVCSGLRSNPEAK